MQGKEEELFKAAFQKLTSNSPQQFWTSGQWMTEKKGGSDAGQYIIFLKFTLVALKLKLKTKKMR